LANSGDSHKEKIYLMCQKLLPLSNTMKLMNYKRKCLYIFWRLEVLGL